MDKIYAILLINNKRTWASIPATDKAKTDVVLKDYVSKGTITQDQYNAIMA